MKKKKPARNDEAGNSDTESQDLTRKLLAVTLYQAGASYDVIARMTGKGKKWVVDTFEGLPGRRRQ